MDSINKNQQEDNREDLTGGQAIEKLKQLAEKADVCFFCTKINTHESFATRPMSIQKADDEGNLWFLSATDSHKNAEIDNDPYVQLLFKGSDYSDFLSVYGYASINQDKAIIKELWRPIMKDWFTEGESDPRISVIKIKPIEGFYWDTKHNMVVGFVKRLIGAAIGKTMDDSVEGTIKV